VKRPAWQAFPLAGLLTGLYPKPFRDEFGEEMRVVLDASLAEAARHGALAAGLVVLRELADLPLNLLREHLRAAGRKEGWIMNHLSPSPHTRAGQLGAIGFGLGFAFLGLFFSTVVITQIYQTSLSFSPLLTAAWIAANFIAGCLGGAGIGLGIHPEKVRAYALLGGIALALATLAGTFADRLGVTFYLLNVSNGQYRFGLNLISILLLGPLVGFGLGLAEHDVRRGLRLAGVGFFAFIIGFIASTVAGTVEVGVGMVGPKIGIYTGLGAALPPRSVTVIVMGLTLMAIAGAIAGAILGKTAAEEAEGFPARGTT
jgi:hypothetical protein